MPASVTQRAEQVLNSISYALRDIQSQAYDTQDRVAKQTQEVYRTQKQILCKKPAVDIFSLATRALVGWFAPAESMRSFSPPIPNLTPKQHAQELAKTKQAHIDLFERCIGAASSSWLDPSNTAAQAEIQKLQAGQAEISTLQTGLQTMIQTHDAAIQRLQNMEAAARQAG